MVLLTHFYLLELVLDALFVKEVFVFTLFKSICEQLTELFSLEYPRLLLFHLPVLLLCIFTLYNSLSFGQNLFLEFIIVLVCTLEWLDLFALVGLSEISCVVILLAYGQLFTI